MIAPPAAATPERAKGATRADVQQLVRDLEALRREHGVPALALTLVTRDGTLWSGALGTADLTTGRPAGPRTRFRIGSITKTFTALAMLLLHHEGKLPLQTVLKDVAPDVPLSNPWSGTQPVRIVHLLEHTAGLLDLQRAEFDLNRPMSLAQGLAFAPQARRCLWPPGRHASYSNAGAGLAAYALEQVTRQSYEDFVRQRIFAPLGMHSAGLNYDAATARALATGYDTDGKSVIPYWHMIFRPFGAINVEAGEMGALIRLLLNRGRTEHGRLLPAALIERMETPATTLAAASGLRYGYGLGLYAFVHKGFVFYGHGGDGDGYLAHFAYERSSGLGYFVVINAFKGKALARLRKRIQDFIVHDRSAPPQPAVFTLNKRQRQSLIGRYQAVTRRFPWTETTSAYSDWIDVYVDKDKLYTRRKGQARQALIPVRPQHFRRPGEPLATLAIVRHEGEQYLQSDAGNYRKIQTPLRRVRP